MILKAADWVFQVDIPATRQKTTEYSKDHCTCSYCQNYYDTVENAYPGLKKFLEEFGVCIHGPVEVMPLEPTLFLACYRITGKIQSWGFHSLQADGILILPEPGENGTFSLWVGEMELPWVQPVSPEDVVSPANYPEFLERMHNIWLFRHENPVISS